MERTKRRSPQPKPPKAGTQGQAFARLKGSQRHVSVYPVLTHGGGAAWYVDRTQPVEDFTLDEAAVLIKTCGWQHICEWTELEPGVFVTRVEKE